MKRDMAIALRLQAHNILMLANMEGGGYTRNESSKAAYDSIRQMPADCRMNFLKRIIAGAKDMIELCRWPTKPSKALLTLLRETKLLRGHVMCCRDGKIINMYASGRRCRLSAIWKLTDALIVPEDETPNYIGGLA